MKDGWPENAREWAHLAPPLVLGAGAILFHIWPEGCGLGSEGWCYLYSKSIVSCVNGSGLTGAYWVLGPDFGFGGWLCFQLAFWQILFFAIVYAMYAGLQMLGRSGKYISRMALAVVAGAYFGVIVSMIIGLIVDKFKAVMDWFGLILLEINILVG